MSPDLRALLALVSRPLVLPLVACLAAVIGALVWRLDGRRRARLAMLGDFQVVQRLLPTETRVALGSRWRAAILSTAALLIGIALAGPQWGMRTEQRKDVGIDVTLVLDVSASMLATDEGVSRLQRMKDDVQRLLVTMPPSSRIALLIVAGRSYVLTPLTADQDALMLFLDGLDPSMVSQGGTALADGLQQALKTFGSGSGDDRAVVLMSDGETWDDETTIKAATQELKAARVSLITVSYGSSDGASIPIGRGEFKRDGDGVVVITRANPAVLRALAADAGGVFVDGASADRPVVCWRRCGDCGRPSAPMARDLRAFSGTRSFCGRRCASCPLMPCWLSAGDAAGWHARPQWCLRASQLCPAWRAHRRGPWTRISRTCSISGATSKLRGRFARECNAATCLPAHNTIWRARCSRPIRQRQRWTCSSGSSPWRLTPSSDFAHCSTSAWHNCVALGQRSLQMVLRTRHQRLRRTNVRCARGSMTPTRAGISSCRCVSNSAAAAAAGNATHRSHRRSQLVRSQRQHSWSNSVPLRCSTARVEMSARCRPSDSGTASDEMCRWAGLVSVLLAVAFQISVSVQVADTIVARTQIPVTVRATAPGNTAPGTTVPRADGAVFTHVAEQTRVGGGFGQAVATRETRYLLTATQVGSIVVSPVVASLGADRVISAARVITVLAPPRNAVPALVLRAPLSRSREVNFHALVTRDTVWAGEQVTAQVGVFIDDELRASLRRSPEYVASSVDGAVSYDLPVANDALPSRDVEGVRYRPFIFARALFPLLPGLLTIPPSRLNYTLGGAGSLYGQGERQTATTEALRVVVRELPSSGRPASFTGAVGVYALTASLDRTTVRGGDALQLTVRIDGVGNIRYLPAPRLEFRGASVTSAGESIAVDSSDLLIRGSKTLRYLISPEAVGALDLGALRYAYFNPVTGVYQETVAPLGTVRVLEGGVNARTATADGAPAPLPLAVWTPASTGDVTDRVWFRVLLALLLLPWCALLTRRIWFFTRGYMPAERRAASLRGRNRASDDVRSLRMEIADTLAPIARLAPDAPIESGDFTRRLRRAGVRTEAAEAAAALITRLDRASFGSPGDTGAVQATQLASEWESLRAQILRERSLRHASAAVRSLVIALASGAVALSAQPLAAQPLAVQRADSAYHAGRFDRAAYLFASAASDDPSNASLWANLGAAHFMRADTAGALLAWQRSERLSPHGYPATNLLAQFVFTGTPATRRVPVTPDVVWMALLGVTAALSSAAALWRWRGRRLPNAVLIGGTLVILSLAAGAVLAERSRDAVGIVMLRRDAALRAEPVLAGEVVARSRAGEIAVVRDARGAWRLIAVAGRTAGWVEAVAIRSLALADGRDVALMEARIASDADVP